MYWTVFNLLWTLVYFFKVNVTNPVHTPIRARAVFAQKNNLASSTPCSGPSVPSGNPTTSFSSCNNFNVSYWSWNYRACWHKISVHFGRSIRTEGTGRSKTSEGYWSSVVSRSLVLFLYRPSHPPGERATGKIPIFATSSDSLGWKELAIHTSATWTIHSGRAALTNLGRIIELQFLLSLRAYRDTTPNSSLITNWRDIAKR